MPTLNPAQMLFSCTLMMGTLLAISSTSWFTAWIGLELNLLSFIPLLITPHTNRYSSESALKYFLIQALGSSLILASAPLTLFFYQTTTITITLSLLLKMGAAPFHFWFPPVMQGITWPQCIIVSTIQKIAPMLLLFSTQTNHFSVITMASILSAIVGSIGGLNQTLTRKVLAYSSINHISWMLASILFNQQMWTIYFLIYTLVSSSVILIFHSNQIFHFNQLSSLSTHSKLTTLTLMLSLLSLGGLPPMLGFFPKWLIIQHFISQDSFIWLAILLMSALLTLFFYLRIATSSMMLASPKVKTSLFFYSKMILMASALINFSPLLYPFIFLSAF